MPNAMPRKRPRRWGRTALIVGVALVALALVAIIVKSFLTETGTRKRTTVHQIAILKPPPPPPPPKPQEKPPEIKKEEVKLPEPEAKSDPAPAPDQPPGDKLGLDADGTAGSDAFGLAARKGGKDITTIGGGGGDGATRAQFGFYTSLIKRHFDEELAKDKKLRASEYRAVIKVWLGRDGKVERFELSGSSGSAQTDEALKLAFMEMRPLREPPPENMPQPVRLRITARGAG